MKIPNLKEMMIGISDAKKQFNELITSKSTKLIIKNNQPVSILMPYDDYINLVNGIDNMYGNIRDRQEITLPNGITLMVCAGVGRDPLNSDGIDIKTFIKMKTSGQYKLHYTLHLGSPNISETLTPQEMVAEFTQKMRITNSYPITLYQTF